MRNERKIIRDAAVRLERCFPSPRKGFSPIILVVLLWKILSASIVVDGRRIPWIVKGNPPSPSLQSSRLSIRGGDDGTANDDEERYSRQVYTMGARAHGLIRSSTIYINGPVRSGLLWEAIKNLGLSGVGKMVLVLDEESSAGDTYHNPSLDDLGATYIRGALAELEYDTTKELTSRELVGVLVDFLHRLNPALEVSTISKAEFQTRSDQGGVLVSIDRPFSEQAEWNRICREGSTKFVSVETAGVYGRVFCDFGECHEIHDADGETPLVVPLDRVEHIENGTILVKTVQGERHDVSRDDIVFFQRSDGSTMETIPCQVAKVETPERIQLTLINRDDSPNESLLDTINTEAVTFSRQKQVQEVSFRSLEEVVTDAYKVFQGESHSEIFTPCDLDKSFDETRRMATFGCFQALDGFMRKHHRLPSSSDFDEFCNEAAQGLCGGEESKAWKEHCQNFLTTCPAKFVPLQAIFGAIASQECLKAVSGLYNPIQQYLLYDCDEVLNDSSTDETCTTGLSFVLGSECIRKLQAQKIFVVGSGAIGCEILKNMAAMGVGTRKSGKIVVTDMDTIEKSNLSRQLLFRDEDIGKFKSKASEEAVSRMNPKVKVESHTSKVGDEEDPGPFDSNFWSKGVDVVLNALDNMEARLFMDEQCVANQKALVDAGTLGSKGNVQVVVPHQSESYGSSADPPEPAIPVCTLKNFPYAISHTIQWGRDLFDGLFVRRPQQANQYASIFFETGVDGLIEKLDDEMGDEAAFEAASELAQDLRMPEGGWTKASRSDLETMAMDWAVALARDLFRDSIEELLLEHPIDKLDEDGEPFWSGSRKPPRPLSFSEAEELKDQEEVINNNMIDFIRSAARLRFETLTGIPSDSRKNIGIISEDDAKKSLLKREEGMSSSKEEKDSKLTKRDRLQSLLAPLNDLSESDTSMRSLSSAEFEKDDEANDHIAFITAASNLRAICYGIAPVDTMETRKVAGKIVPAMITTTAFVSALSCMELIKLTQGVPLNRHKNAFINLALPFFAFTSPLPAEEYPGVRGEAHTLWDRISIKESKKAAQAGGLTLRRLLRRIQKKAYKDDPDAIQVSNISIGPIMIYASFLHEEDDELLEKSIWTVIEEAVQAGEEFEQEFSRDGPSENDTTKDVSSITSVSFIDMVVSVEDTETFDEIELPQVRLYRSQ